MDFYPVAFSILGQIFQHFQTVMLL